jgi:hypothetical protein
LTPFGTNLILPMEGVGVGRMGVVSYRCPTAGENISTAIEASKDTLVKMRTMDLTIWVWCPHCMAGHQIKPADAVLEGEVRTVFSPSLIEN